MDQNEEKSVPTPKDRAKIFSAKSQRERIRLVTRIAYFVIVVLVLLFVLFLIAKIFFSVDSVIVNMTTHEEQNYDVNTVRKASGVSEGDILFFIDKDEVEENIKKSLPFIDSVTVKKEFPNTLTITVEEEKESFYFRYDDRYFVISSDLKVLAFFDDESKLKAAEYYNKLIPVALDEVKMIEMTETVAFFDENSYRRSEKVLSLICESELYGKITSVDISELYDVRIVYDNRIDIFFGDHNDELEKKLVTVDKIIKEYGDKAKGYIYIYNPQEAQVNIK